MTPTELHKERISILDKMDENAKAAANANRETYWLKKRLRVVEQQIKEAEATGETESQNP